MQQQLIILLKQLVNLLWLQVSDIKRQILLKHAKACIGKDMAPTQDIFGCAEAVNNVCKQALGFEVGGGVSTLKMYEALKTSTNFKAVDNPLPGDIILSPTGYGSGRLSNGHVGIVSDNNKIMSNNSSTALWDEHFTLETWRARYAQVGGFPVLFFRLI